MNPDTYVHVDVGAHRSQTNLTILVIRIFPGFPKLDMLGILFAFLLVNISTLLGYMFPWFTTGMCGSATGIVRCPRFSVRSENLSLLLVVLTKNCLWHWNLHVAIWFRILLYATPLIFRSWWFSSQCSSRPPKAIRKDLRWCPTTKAGDTGRSFLSLRWFLDEVLELNPSAIPIVGEFSDI